MADPNAVKSLLKDVALYGVAIERKRKLLWLLGYIQDRPTAWGTLLDHWEGIGEKREKLCGAEAGEFIILTQAAKLEPIHKAWATE